MAGAESNECFLIRKGGNKMNLVENRLVRIHLQAYPAHKNNV